MMADKKLRIEEVALQVGVSSQTINMWYKWKKENPTHELAMLLPDYEQASVHQMRWWKQSDVWKLIEFKQNRPRGCKGVMGDVTHRYRKERKD